MLGRGEWGVTGEIRALWGATLACCLWLCALPSAAELGEIQYDTGVLVAPSSHPDPGFRTFGNRFDRAVGASSASGAVQASGSVTRLTFYLAGLGGTNAFLSVFGPVSGSTAMPLRSVNVTGLVPGWNTYTFSPPVPYSGASFLAGVWNRNPSATSPIDDAIGLDSATRLGQGHHGFSIEDLNGTGFTPLPNNAMIRAFGNVLPPELATGLLRVSLVDELVVDADGSGFPSPGDTLRYTAELRNEGSVDADGVQVVDGLGEGLSLVPGSVTASRGAVTTGNSPADTGTAVALGTLAADGDSATVTFEATLSPILAEGVTLVRTQSEVTGTALGLVPSDDPDVNGAPGAPDPTATVVGFPLGTQQKLKIKLRFDRVGKDSIRLKVKALALRGDFQPEGAEFALDIGGNVLIRTLDAKGRFNDGVDRIRLKQRKKDGTWKLRYKRRRGAFASDFDDEGLDAGDHAGDPVAVDVQLLLEGTLYALRVPLEYRSKAGRSGIAN
jgi:uncharacterized repeat protein (TIGR01451 family)